MLPPSKLLPLLYADGASQMLLQRRLRQVPEEQTAVFEFARSPRFDADAELHRGARAVEHRNVTGIVSRGADKLKKRAPVYDA
jgi:hypothetical protein